MHTFNMTTSDQLELAVVAKGQMSLTATALFQSCGVLFHDVDNNAQIENNRFEYFVSIAIKVCFWDLPEFFKEGFSELSKYLLEKHFDKINDIIS